MTPQLTHRPTRVLVMPARPGIDDADAHELFAEQRRWLRRIGIDAWQLHEATAHEYTDPIDYYRRGALLLAHVDHAIVGMIAYAPWSTDTAELRRLYVRPSARGSAAGAALVEALLSTIRHDGFEHVVLDTLPGPMDAAVALYRRAGFHEVAAFHVDHPGIIGMRMSFGDVPIDQCDATGP